MVNTISTQTNDVLEFEYGELRGNLALVLKHDVTWDEALRLVSGSLITTEDGVVYQYAHPRIEDYKNENGQTYLVVSELDSTEVELESLRSQVGFLEMMTLDPFMGM